MIKNEKSSLKDERIPLGKNFSLFWSSFLKDLILLVDGIAWNPIQSQPSTSRKSRKYLNDIHWNVNFVHNNDLKLKSLDQVKVKIKSAERRNKIR